MPKKIDWIGKKFGRLTVAYLTPNTKKIGCTCDCGNITEVHRSNLRGGITRSCGCIFLEFSRSPRKHKDLDELTYNTWASIKTRCLNKNDHVYKYYGARGITICQAWHEYQNFYKDMGKRPSKDYTIDRINNDGNYEPGNCRWATKKEQAQNRRCRRTRKELAAASSQV